MDQNQEEQHQNSPTGRATTTPTQIHAIDQFQSNNRLPPLLPLPLPLKVDPLTQVFANPFAAPSHYLISHLQQYDQYQNIPEEEEEEDLPQKLKSLWERLLQNLTGRNCYRYYELPLARIRKIMKSNEDVNRLSMEIPAIFEKACQMFIVELTLRSWANARENKRRELQKNDMAAVVTKYELFDFLQDVVFRDETLDNYSYSDIRRSSGGGGANNNNIGVGPNENNDP